MDRETTIDLGGELVTYAARLVRTARQANQLSAGTRALSLLDQHGATGISALAELDGCSQPTMSTLVRGLEVNGWVDKRPHPDDARSALVTLTDAGRAELARVRRRNGEAVVERLAHRLDQHPERTVADLATAVAVLRDVLEPAPQIPSQEVLA